MEKRKRPRRHRSLDIKGLLPAGYGEAIAEQEARERAAKQRRAHTPTGLWAKLNPADWARRRGFDLDLARRLAVVPSDVWSALEESGVPLRRVLDLCNKALRRNENAPRSRQRLAYAAERLAASVARSRRAAEKMRAALDALDRIVCADTKPALATGALRDSPDIAPRLATVEELHRDLEALADSMRPGRNPTDADKRWLMRELARLCRESAGGPHDRLCAAIYNATFKTDWGHTASYAKERAKAERAVTVKH